MKNKPYLGAMVISAFISFISAMQIDSAHTDGTKLNVLYYTATIAFGLVAIVAGYLAYKQSQK